MLIRRGGILAAVGATGLILANSNESDKDVVPPYPGLGDLSECTPGRKIVEKAMHKNYKGRISIEQEYFCPCGQITRHTIILNAVVVHDHFRPGPPKGDGGGD
jgi:hypothetical protein